jgi:hypothetical protein
MHAAESALETATDAADIAKDSVGNVAKRVVGVVHHAADTIDERVLRPSATLRVLRKAFLPEVQGQGGDFGPGDVGGSEPVVLRLEIATSAEVKSITWISWLLTLLAMGVTVRRDCDAAAAVAALARRGWRGWRNCRRGWRNCRRGWRNCRRG